MPSPGSPAAEVLAQRLVLAGLRCRFHRDAQDECARLASRPELDWPTLVGCARAEQVAPLLHHVWRSATWLAPPAATALRAAYVETGSRNALVARDLALALDSLRAADVPVVVLKGAALAERIYRNVALRPMVDIDLLVRPSDLPRALRAMAALGWHPERAEVAPGARLQYDNEVALTGPHPLSTPLELHWSLVDGPFYQARQDTDWLWASAVAATLVGRPGQVLGPEAQLLHLCAHLALHHRGRGLLWHHDVAELVNGAGGAVDWPDLCRRAAAAEQVLPVQTVLERVGRDWAIAPPPAARAALAALQATAAESRTFARLRAPERSVARRFADDLADLPTWRERLAFSARNVWPSPAYMRDRYRLRHAWWLPLAYPYRWWRALRSVASGRRRE